MNDFEAYIKTFQFVLNRGQFSFALASLQSERFVHSISYAIEEVSEAKMQTKNLNLNRALETGTLFKRSLIYQTKEFFENSTLHGVRYIAETGRPIGEKFMWFCFTSTAAVTALVIIMSLWEKFQTNPTITGLDTDFHNQNVIFPTTVVCPAKQFDHEKAYDVAYKSLANYDHATAELATPFLELLTQLTLKNIKHAYELSQSVPKTILMEKSLREWAFLARINCEDFLWGCKYRDEPIDCCSNFDTVYTEHGMCFAFNTRFKSEVDADVKASEPHDLFETDKKWGLYFMLNETSKIFLFAHEEYLGRDFNGQIEWNVGEAVEVRFSKKNTYTTDDARQLTIGQRKCIFGDEIQLQYFPDEYTYSSCMKECRIKKAIKLCKCNPPFYKPITKVDMCTVDDFLCLDKHRDNITNIKDCRHCELSCSKTVYNIEKLNKNYEQVEDTSVLVEFLTWPITRYKREVLFGWVDLLVSFGGIASLFLGFSLLSGVEIIYYFTLRACCMVYKNRQELYEIEEEIRRKPPPYIDLSLKAKLHKIQPKPRKGLHDDDTRKNLNHSNGNEVGSRRKTNKDFIAYSRSLYNSPKLISRYPEAWQPEQYLP